MVRSLPLCFLPDWRRIVALLGPHRPDAPVRDRKHRSKARRP
jgi:hypothetical protein